MKTDFFRNHRKALVRWGIELGLMAISVFGGIKFYSHEAGVVVPGKVIAKNEGIRSHYKSSKVYSEFWIAVAPDEPDKYKTYSVQVDFAAYATLNPGDHTAFKVPLSGVDKLDGTPGWVYMIYFGLFLIPMFFWLVILPVSWAVSDDESDKQTEDTPTDCYWYD